MCLWCERTDGLTTLPERAMCFVVIIFDTTQLKEEEVVSISTQRVYREQTSDGE